MTKRRPSSARWLFEHHHDAFVLKARREGYRSRAAYKLLELVAASGLDEKNKKVSLVRPGMLVVDLGAAPGGWTQVATQLVGQTGRVVAVDLLDMPPVAGAMFIQGDFMEDAVMARIVAAITPRNHVDVVLSDMAPNMTGIKAADQAHGELLAESAFAFAQDVLQPGGSLILKLFDGPGFHATVRQARQLFARIKIVKPEASRARSAEHYLLGITFKKSQCLMK